MFFDLNVQLLDERTLSAVVEMLIRLGYDGCAINQVSKGRFPPSLVNKAAVRNGRCKPQQCQDRDVLREAVTAKIPLSEDAAALLKARGRKFQQLSRLTVLLENQDDSYALNGNSPAAKQFDIVAVTPLTEKLFAQCCEKLDVDVITLDLAHRLPYFIKPKQANVAIERGVYFEIGYSAAISDMSARKTLISNAIQLVRATKQKNIIITSQAARAMQLRGPYDVANLGRLFGFSAAASKQAISSNIAAALVHGSVRRTAKGAVAVVMSASLGPEQAWMLEDDDSEEDSRDEDDDGSVGGGERKDVAMHDGGGGSAAAASGGRD